MWLKKLKIAVVEKDTKKFSVLLEKVPKLEDPREIEEALYLIDAAKEILENLKDKTQVSMIQIKKNIDFLNSARVDKPARFDITS
jgi:hypothetical protein